MGMRRIGRIKVQGEEYNLNCAERNSRGQYSDAVLNELESQNDGQVEGIMGKVRQLKDVCSLPLTRNDPVLTRGR